MKIREKENLLFERWRHKYAEKSFMVDGCPNPSTYELESPKIVFVLKDGNMGDSGKPGDEHDQRHELEHDPHPWWGVIARWCFFIKFPNASWEEGLRAIGSPTSIKEALSRHCFMQLKKSWGFGSVSNDDLYNVVINDRTEILEQLSIYSPDFIIACGNGDHLKRVFDCTDPERKMTIDGVGFWRVFLGKHQAILVDYCHPSIRIGTKVNGFIARGLASALTEIGESTPNVSLNSDAFGAR